VKGSQGRGAKGDNMSCCRLLPLFFSLCRGNGLREGGVLSVVTSFNMLADRGATAVAEGLVHVPKLRNVVLWYGEGGGVGLMGLGGGGRAIESGWEEEREGREGRGEGSSGAGSEGCGWR
jgi:hypothetical protein